MEFDFDWFASVPDNLSQIKDRRAEQWTLLQDLLKMPASAPLGQDPAQQWYNLPFLANVTPLSLVLDPASGGGGVIGVGIADQWAAGKASVAASAYSPLFDTAGKSFVVVGSADYPIVLALTCTLDQTLPDGIDGVTLLCHFSPDGTSAPGFSLTFTGPHGALPVVDSLQRLVRSDATAWANAALGDAAVKQWLDQKVGSSTITRGAVLVAAGLLDSSGGYKLANLSALAGESAVAIGESLLAGALRLLASDANPLVPLGKGGIRVFANGNEYGLRLCIEDVDLATADGTNFKLQLGKMLAADTDANNWVSRGNPPAGAMVEPGVSLTLLAESADTPPKPSFRPKLDLVSIGLDIDGASGNPLVNMKGVTLGSIQPRFLLSCDPANIPIYWGAALQADDLGIPLGNGLTGANANPVAQNLLSSGGGGGDNQAVNPQFSASIAGMSHPGGAISLDVQLHSNLGSGNQVWIPVQRSFGPLHCRRVGVQWPDDNPDRRIDFLFDGGVALSMLQIDLQGLSLGIPLAAPGSISDYSLDLQGLGIACEAGPVTISGGFLKSADMTPVEYDGAALIQAASWTISAEGSYATLASGDPSMFIFAQLAAELGGPPFFFVTGLCAGFGYNRSLRIPNQDQVPAFPLLAGIADPSQIGGADARPAAALAALTTPIAWVAPAQGSNWIAAGVQFTSFDLVKSNVVVTAVFAQNFQAAILGVSRIKLGQEGPQFAYAELGLEVVVQPSAGYFGASAVLSPNSYLLTPDCHLTGGFAFWLWYSGDYAGDFVLTLGGYHPAFQVPLHYPNEPRLGFSWQVDGNVTVQGSAYFALTPSCVMGGGELDVLFHSGDLRAWFTAQADFLFTWKPFYFIGDVSVSIGASYKIDLLFTSVTVSVELGASLSIWGPPTGGKVHVSWFIISFSVSFGADPAGSGDFQTWDQFSTLIPKRPASQGQLAASGQALVLEAAAADPVGSGVLTITVSNGLLGSDSGAWLLRADTLTFAIATPIPATSLVLDGAVPLTWATPAPGNQIAVRPMGVAGVTSALTVSIIGPGPADKKNLEGWTWAPVLQGVPAALWGAPLPAGATPTTPSADTLPSCLVGISGLNPPDVHLSGPAAFPVVDLDYFDIDDGDSDWLPLNGTDPPVARQPAAGSGSLQAVEDSIADPAVARRRTDMFMALRGFGYDPGTNGDTGAIKSNVNLSYPDAPMLGSPWQEAA